MNPYRLHTESDDVQTRFILRGVTNLTAAAILDSVACNWSLHFAPEGISEVDLVETRRVRVRRRREE